MDNWLEFARGPAFRFAVAIFVLGLARHLLLAILSVRGTLKVAGDKILPGASIRRTTLAWLFPTEHLRHRPGMSSLSVLFHAGVILAPLFLASHVILIERAIGLSWPTLPALVADVLTLAAIVGLTSLLVMRIATREGRGLSRLSDYVILPIVAAPFLTGFLAMHPALNPFPFAGTLLVHILSVDLLLAIVPVTKLAHIALYPTTQLVSEAGWHFRPDAGERVARALGKENQPI